MFPLSFIYFLFWLSSLQWDVCTLRAKAGPVLFVVETLVPGTVLVQSRCCMNPWWITSQLQPRAALWASDPLVPDAPSLLVLHPELQVTSTNSLFWRNPSGNTRSLQSNTKLGCKTPAVTDRKEKPKQTIPGNLATASWLGGRFAYRDCIDLVANSHIVLAAVLVWPPPWLVLWNLLLHP